MNDQQLPYFFPEAMRVAKRLNDRERQLTITENDRDFLRNLFFANAAGRKAQSPAMIAERLLVNLPGHTAIELAGAFVMGSEGSYTPVFFYGPETGLEKFSTYPQMIEELQSRLQDEHKRDDLLRFLSIDQRADFAFLEGSTLTRQLIEGNVFDEQKACIERHQQLNVQAMLDELSKLPLIETLLEQLLANTLRKAFPNVDQRKTHVFFYALAADPTDQDKWVEALQLPDALLLFYRQQSWPVGQRREFTNPQVVATQETNTQWEDGLKQAAHQLHLFLYSALETYWNTEVHAGQSRRTYFAQAMSDKSRVDLLFKRQEEVISAQERQQLDALYLPANRRVTPQIEKVRLWEYYAHAIELAGTLVISNTHTYLYTQPKGLQVLKDYDDLQATLKAMARTSGHEDDFFAFLALEERTRFIGFEDPQFSSTPISGLVFSTLFEDILRKQRQSLDYCLDIYRRNLGAINAYAMLDHGLDIRAMLDHRLLALDPKGRWSTHPSAPSVPAEKARQTIRQLHSVADGLSTLLTQVPTLNTVIADQLRATLNLPVQQALDPMSLYINHYAGNADDQERRTPQSSQSLLSHCVARVIGEAQAIPDSREYGVYGPQVQGLATKRPEISIARLNDMMTHWLLGLNRKTIAQLPRDGLEALIPTLAHSLSVGVLEEARLRGLDKTLGERDINILRAVLNPDNTAREQRNTLEGFTPDAFTLSVLVTGKNTLFRLANCFVLTERGGLDQSHSGHAVLWTPAGGVEAFASVKYLRESLAHRLRTPSLRLGLLENLGTAERLPHQCYDLGPLQLIKEAVLSKCQQSWIDYCIAQRQHILTLKANAQSMHQILGQARSQVPANNLQRAIDIARLTELRHSLYDPLGAAPAREQRRQAEILEQYRINTLHGRDYLHDLRPLRQHVEDALNDMLVDYSLFATDVTIVPRLALAGQRQGLLDFAMNPSSLQTPGFDVVSTSSSLTEAVVRQMLTQLKIHDDYHAYLTEHLSTGKSGVDQRRKDFSQQLPWQLLQHAHTLKLQEHLSDRGFDLVQQVFNMPDAIARASVAGTTAIIRPLELIATAGATTAPALGLYLIGAGREGPQVLYAPYHSTLSFTEFESEAQFLENLNLPGALQECVLKRLAAPQDTTYRNLLSSTLGKKSEITLGFTPIQGNLFSQLFDDNLALLLKWLGARLIHGAETEWETVKQVFSESGSRVLSLLPGKLALPWMIWQSISLFKESAEALQDHHWRKALQTFIEGVAQMAALGQALQEAESLIFDPAQPTPAAQPQSAAHWSKLDITAPQRTLLSPSEVNDIALVNMSKNELNGTYQHKGASYIPLAGKVYKAQSLGKFWRISTEQQNGPFIHRNNLGQWEIDTRQHISRFGQAYGRLQDRSQSRASARRSMSIEAVGMRAIRALYPERARMIVEAMDLATFYTQNCKLNLALLAPGIAPVTRIHRFVNEFFGIDIDPLLGPQEIDPILVQKLHRIVDLILGGLLDPTLYSLDSQRFVAGTHRTDPQNNWAFTIDRDPEQRIYLADNFFAPPLSDYDNLLPDYFDRAAHARATLLIHEMSHLVALTADSAYLNSMMPFSDLIVTLTQAGRDLARFQKSCQGKGYSRKTPVSQLFKLPGVSGTHWSDVGETPETKYIKDQILRTTGGVDLSNARGIFMTNLARRVDTILDNADSVALLITHLGRQLDPVPSSRRESIN
ncbi:dermonecrotic toxin domain-containing protein [Pseudomonas brenneri]|uniref:dermonecrotic toxin domain-containing protein n=1 Tax=Pseudomonas brenneri TaxID=129817 RepID=UPI0035716D7B